MSKYEIMLILDPKAEVDNTKKIADEVFKKDLESFEKMDRTDLAYEINGSLKGTYLLIHVNTEGKNIIEFKRRLSLTKDVWRELSINLDREIKLDIKPIKSKEKEEKKSKDE